MLDGKNLIYIKKRFFVQWITLFIVIMPLFLQALLQFFKLPDALKYTIDLAWIAILFVIFSTKLMSVKKRITPLVILTIVFFVYCVFVYLFNFESIFYFLWGFRNNFRFYIAFFAFVLFLDQSDVDSVIKLIDILFVVNFLVILYQVFVLDLVGDFCGGIFGAKTGSNASTLVFLSIIVSLSVLQYMSGKASTISCWLKCLVSLIIAAMAELKMFLIFFVLIVIMATFLTRFSWKKTVFIIVAIVLLGIASSLLTRMFESVISIESILKFFKYTSYSSEKDLGRFTAIPQISEMILKDVHMKLFGMGLGNSDTSSLAIFNTPFFQRYSYLHYSWFSSATLFLEIGYIGLTVYLLFYVICFASAYKMYVRGVNKAIYCQLSMIMSVLCVALTFYNSSLRTEIGYLAYFALALPFIEMKQHTVD